MLLSKTWPFESKLSDTSFEEQLQQNMHNLQSTEKQPCSCVLVLWQRLYCKLHKVFLVSVVMQEERQECQTQAGAERCQTPGRNLETGGHAKTNGVSLRVHTLPSRNAASRTQMLDRAEAKRRRHGGR